MPLETTEVAGKDVFLYKGNILVGCATTSSISASVDMLEASCKSTGGWKARKPGQKSWTASLSGIVKTYAPADDAANIAVDEWFDDLVAGTKVTIKFGTTTVGDAIYTGDGYVTSWSKEAPTDGLQTYSVEIEGTGALVKSLVVAP